MADTLFAPDRPFVPDLTTYDVILANSSGGKDSQTMLAELVRLADDAGVRHRITVVHADLGRMEWDGTRDLAARQANHYSLPFVVVANQRGDLLAAIEERGMFPDRKRRYCTSDFKRGPVLTAMTALTDTAREAGITNRRVRILNCLGMRAQESPSRAKLVPFSHNQRATNQTRRWVDDWLPIHHWTTDQVWAHIAASGVAYHPAYDDGMPRLSCSFCVLASTGALVRAAQLRPELADEYAAVEERIGHSFKENLSMADIIAAAAATEAPPPVDDWAA